jgi:hypothetical protein
MGVKLRRGVAVHRTRGIVLERSGGELARKLRGVHVAEPSLRVLLQLPQSNSDALPVRLADAFIASDQGGERNRLGR